MRIADTLVSIGLPVRNGELVIADAAKSVLAQQHQNMELVISDNASTDGTEQVCRELARSDPRVRYHRQPENIGLMNNFVATMRLARGTFFRWIGDDDSLAPEYVSHCLAAFAEDARLMLVTTRLAYIGPDGASQTGDYHGDELRAEDPIVRFAEMLRLLNESHLLIDPLYGLMRREWVAAVPRRNMLREDEVFAAKLALAGRWGHVPEVLGVRHWKHERLPTLTRRLGVPAWHAHAANTLQCRELRRYLRGIDLNAGQRRRAHAAVARMYTVRQRQVAVRRARKLRAMAAMALTSRTTSRTTGRTTGRTR